MDVDRKVVDDYDHLQEITSCARLHSQGERGVEIKKKLGISAVRVARALDEGVQLGVIKVAVYPPAEESTEKELVERYKEKNLREAHVFHIGIEEEIIHNLGKLAASYLEDIISRKQDEVKRIAIGPGRTMLAFARSLSGKRMPQMEVGSTVSEGRVESYVAPNTIMGILAGKWECEFYRFNPASLSDDGRDYADVLFFGVGIIPNVIPEDVRDLSPKATVDLAAIVRARSLLDANGAAGIINYQPIGKEGNPMPWNIKEIDSVLRELALGLDVIRDMAKRKKVVCVAGGAKKVDAIRAALRGGYFNTLITDFDTAAKVLED